MQFAMDIRGFKRLLQSLRRESAVESLAPSASSQLSPAAAAAVRAGGVAQGPCKSTSWQVPLCLLVVHLLRLRKCLSEMHITKTQLSEEPPVLQHPCYQQTVAFAPYSLPYRERRRG